MSLSTTTIDQIAKMVYADIGGPSESNINWDDPVATNQVQSTIETAADGTYVSNTTFHGIASSGGQQSARR